MTRCKEFYERFDELRHIAKEIKGYCEVDAQKSIQRFGEYIDFCTKYDLRPFGLIPEGALRPLIAGRNSDIAQIVVEQLKTRMKSDNPKIAQITNKVVRQLIAEIRRTSVDAPAFPDKKYRCLVIDPPWPVQKIEREERPNQGPELDYPTMTLEEISDLPIPKLADSEGCHVYLWVTHKLLPEGLKLFETWGVKYQCLLTWVKSSGMTPFSWMYNSEHVLFGRIGHLELLQNGVKLAFQAPNQIHSRKPDIFYEVVRMVSPPPRLNMYARGTIGGFESYGNEVTKFDELREGLVVRTKV